MHQASCRATAHLIGFRVARVLTKHTAPLSVAIADASDLRREGFGDGWRWSAHAGATGAQTMRATPCAPLLLSNAAAVHELTSAQFKAGL